MSKYTIGHALIDDLAGLYDMHAQPSQKQEKSMSEKRKVTMDDALAAGDGVILNVQAARIKELEEQRDELLEAVQYALDVSAEGLRLGEEWQARARAAIAKAKGESNEQMY